MGVNPLIEKFANKSPNVVFDYTKEIKNFQVGSDCFNNNLNFKKLKAEINLNKN